MIPLDSDRWTELRHAYGAADDVPACLASLLASTGDPIGTDAWEFLWSALAHQGDVDTATREAALHLAAGLERVPVVAAERFLQFIAWVEFCRVEARNGVTFDATLEYEAAVKRALLFGASMVSGTPSAETTWAVCALQATAAGQLDLARLLWQLTPEDVAALVASEQLQEVAWRLRKNDGAGA